MKRLSTRMKGAFLERIAEIFLRVRGYGILERNWRIRSGEIDLIAIRKGVLVFVEVKGRRGGTNFNPFEGITKEKERRLKRLSKAYTVRERKSLRRRRIRRFRFDSIGIYFGLKHWLPWISIDHRRNYFS